MNDTTTPAIQDLYPDDFAHCFGCGRHNPHGHQLKSFVRGEEVVAHFTPSEHHIAVPGFVYGGLLASLVDCHAMATAAAASEHAQGGDKQQSGTDGHVRDDISSRTRGTG